MTQKSNSSSNVPADILSALVDKANRTGSKEAELAAKQQRLLEKLRSNKAHAAATPSLPSATQPSPQDSAPAQPETGFEALLGRIASRAERFSPEEKEMIEAFGFSTGAPLPPPSDDTK